MPLPPHSLQYLRSLPYLTRTRLAWSSRGICIRLLFLYVLCCARDVPDGSGGVMFANNERIVPLTTPSLQVCEVSPLEDVATVLLYTLRYSTLQPDDRIREKRACSTHATGRVDENGYEVRGDCRSPRQRTPQTKPVTERGSTSSSPTCMHGKHSNTHIYRGGASLSC